MQQTYLPWTEKYRPKNLDEIIGQKNIVDRLKSFVSSRNMPNLLFAGPAGIGKTTCALAMAQELYKDGYSQNFLELNASDERGIDVVRNTIKDFARTLPFGGVDFKIAFLDESDALTSDAQSALRRTMEKYTGTCRFILSCNYSSKIIDPIQSRCTVFRFRPFSSHDIQEMVSRISKQEKFNVTEDGLRAINYVCDGDMRRAQNILQSAFASSKEINEKVVFAVSSRAHPTEINKMIECALTGDFIGSRKRLDELLFNYGMSGEDVIKQIYKNIVDSEKIDVDKKIWLVDKIGEFNFRMVEGANERIQLEAMLAQFMKKQG
ncbi:MAG: replication factor C small subunit [Candidatus Diapherotrites archaeon]|nr:replication factor C small subunit [Candidatus Diapherotrites archaeon]